MCPWQDPPALPTSGITPLCPPHPQAAHPAPTLAAPRSPGPGSHTGYFLVSDPCVQSLGAKEPMRVKIPLLQDCYSVKSGGGTEIPPSLPQVTACTLAKGRICCWPRIPIKLEEQDLHHKKPCDAAGPDPAHWNGHCPLGRRVGGGSDTPGRPSTPQGVLSCVPRTWGIPAHLCCAESAGHWRYPAPPRWPPAR